MKKKRILQIQLDQQLYQRPLWGIFVSSATYGHRNSVVGLLFLKYDHVCPNYRWKMISSLSAFLIQMTILTFVMKMTIFTTTQRLCNVHAFK